MTAQAEALVELGCGMAQGLLYGPAVPVERLAPAVELPVAEAVTIGGSSPVASDRMQF